MPEELISIPPDLKLVSDSDLTQLETDAVAEFDRVDAIDDPNPDQVAYQARLTDDIDRIRAEMTAREARRAAEAESARAAVVEQRAHLQARVRGSNGGGSGAGGGTASDAPVDPAAIAEAAARGATAALVALSDNGRRGPGLDINALSERATGSLRDAARYQPATTQPVQRAVVTAGVDIPGIARGGELNDLEALIDAFHRRAKGLPVTRDGRGQEQLVATLRNEFDHTVDDRTAPGQVMELLEFMTGKDKQESLVAGGGWCAPSENRYDFFNVACVDGLVDLPTVGISRGGIRFPTSPSLADAGMAPFSATMSNTTNPWLWTETDDILTVTGATNKPCIRIPCPAFNEVRLECYGICLTAGNLTDDAYPENTANFLRLLVTAHAHAMNARFITAMVGLSSTAVSGGGLAEANDVITQVLGGIALAATDYRARYGMCTDDILEVVAPYWLREVMRAGGTWRSNIDKLSITDAEIAGYFADRGVRVQWVNDWQVRAAGQFGNATPMTAWPTSVDVMIYAAGTFIKGNGLTLDLGVVRDSVLNAENDFTAAWSEECHLVARVGHESRIYRIGFSVSALTAPAATAAPNL